MGAGKHQLPQYIHDGRDLLAVLEHGSDGWHVIVRNHEIGVCADRVAALRLVDTHAESYANDQT